MVGVSAGRPAFGTAQMPMSSPPLERSFLRTQNVTREPSGANPNARTDGLTSSGALPRVKLWNCPDTDLRHPHTSICPSRSDRKATKWPSRETVAACATSIKVRIRDRLKSRVSDRVSPEVLLPLKPECQLPIAKSTTPAAASGKTNVQLLREVDTAGCGGAAAMSGDASFSFSCAARRFRPSAQTSNSAREA